MYNSNAKDQIGLFVPYENSPKSVHVIYEKSTDAVKVPIAEFMATCHSNEPTVFVVRNTTQVQHFSML